MLQPIPYYITPLGDSAATIDYGNLIEEKINRKIKAMQTWLRNKHIDGFKDLIISYSSLTVLYDPWLIYQNHQPAGTVFEWVKQLLEEADQQVMPGQEQNGRVIKIPVCYDDQFGPDLALMAEKKGTNKDSIITLHVSAVYRVYMIGFLPGFAYMGELDEKIAMSRKEKPVQVPDGAVGIAGKQTGIYPLSSPGGWNIIGRTPLKLFNPYKEPPVLLQSGDHVQFYAIDETTFREMSKLADLSIQIIS